MRVRYLGSGRLGEELEARVDGALAWRGAGVTAASQLVHVGGGASKAGPRSEAHLEFAA